MLRLTKSYRLLKFLNWQPPAPFRAVIGAFAAFFAFILSMNFGLAGIIWRGIWAQADLKTAMRRLAWISARSRWGRVVLNDPVFDFAKGLAPQDIGAVETFLKSHGRDDLETRLDRLTIQAARVQYPISLDDWRGVLHHFDTLVEDAQKDDHPKDDADQQHRQGDFPAAAAKTALSDFDALFPQAKLPWFVISGTFLGIVREKGFLPHDYDIDLGVFSEQADLRAITDVVQGSDVFSIHQILHQDRISTVQDGQVHTTQTPVLIKLLHRDGVHLDLFWHFHDGAKIWHGSDLHRWENSTFDLAPYQLCGVDVTGPADFERYLTENYGDWRTPQTSFNASTGTPNLRMVHNLRSFVLFFKRYAYAKRAGQTDADHVARIMIDQGYVIESPAGLKFVPERFIPTNAPARHDQDMAT